MVMRPRKLPFMRRPSFVNPDWELRVLSRADASPVLREPVYANLVDNQDDAVRFRFGGIPLASGSAMVRIGYDERIKTADYVRATDLRTRVTRDYIIVGVDDEPRTWSMICQLAALEMPIEQAVEQ